jgi:hypothetical protein
VYFSNYISVNATSAFSPPSPSFYFLFRHLFKSTIYNVFNSLGLNNKNAHITLALLLGNLHAAYKPGHKVKSQTRPKKTANTGMAPTSISLVGVVDVQYLLFLPSLFIVFLNIEVFYEEQKTGNKG